MSEPPGPPPGYINSSELLDDLVALWWGAEFPTIGDGFEGHQVTAWSRLGRAAAFGMQRACARIIQKAGASKKIEGFILRELKEAPGNELRRVTPRAWSDCEIGHWETDLLLGEIFRIDGPPASWVDKSDSNDPMAWAVGKQLLFERSRTEAWLRELRSPHLLRQPLTADPDILPARSYVTFSEAVSWLVYDKVMSSDELDAKQLDDRRHVVCYAEDEDEEGETEFEFGEWFAAYLATLVRLEDVDRILRDAMASGNLGIKEQNSAANLSGAKLQDVQFKRHDLERLWGSVAGGDSSGAAETSRLNREGAASTGGATAPSEVVPTRKRGRPGKGDKAATVYVKRFLNGHEVESLTLQGACDEIVKSGGKRVVPKTLARALKARGIQ